MHVVTDSCGGVTQKRPLISGSWVSLRRLARNLSVATASACMEKRAVCPVHRPMMASCRPVAYT